MDHSVYFGYGTIRTTQPGEDEIIHGIQPENGVTEVTPIYTAHNSSTGLKEGFFRGVNTWDDWHLIPASRPEIAPPEVYTNYVDLPGVHGKLDLSEYLTGGPVYKNRSGTIDFYAANGYHFWADTYAQMCNFLHGKRLFMVLDDEPEYFYEGRFSVQKWNSDGKTNWSSVSINYELNPFKFLLPRTSLDQYWDRFLFEDITDYKCMQVNANEGKTFIIPGYTNGFMIDGLIDDESSFPASATIKLNDKSVTVSRQSKNALNVHSGTLYPLVNSTNRVTVTGTGLVNLISWGGHL